MNQERRVRECVREGGSLSGFPRKIVKAHRERKIESKGRERGRDDEYIHLCVQSVCVKNVS
jgi:hypothetical protein